MGGDSFLERRHLRVAVFVGAVHYGEDVGDGALSSGGVGSTPRFGELLVNLREKRRLPLAGRLTAPGLQKPLVQPAELRL